MDAKTTKKIKELICMKLEEIARTNSLSSTDVEKLNMLIVAYEKLLKTEEMEGVSERGYSRDGYWRADGEYSKANKMYEDNGESYGRHWVKGHYSMSDASDMTRDHLRKMMSSGNMSESDRRTLERAMDII